MFIAPASKSPSVTSSIEIFTEGVLLTVICPRFTLPPLLGNVNVFDTRVVTPPSKANPDFAVKVIV